MFSALLNDDYSQETPTLGAIGDNAGRPAERSRFFGAVISDSFFGSGQAEEPPAPEPDPSGDDAWAKMQLAAGRMRQSDLTAGSAPFMPATAGRVDQTLSFAINPDPAPVGYFDTDEGKNPSAIGGASRPRGTSNDELESFFDFESFLDDDRLNGALEPEGPTVDPNERLWQDSLSVPEPMFSTVTNGSHEAAAPISQAQALYDKNIAAQAALESASSDVVSGSGAGFDTVPYGSAGGKQHVYPPVASRAAPQGRRVKPGRPASPDQAEWGHLQDDSIAISKAPRCFLALMSSTLTCCRPAGDGGGASEGVGGHSGAMQSPGGN